MARDVTRVHPLGDHYPAGQDRLGAFRHVLLESLMYRVTRRIGGVHQAQSRSSPLPCASSSSSGQMHSFTGATGCLHCEQIRATGQTLSTRSARDLLSDTGFAHGLTYSPVARQRSFATVSASRTGLYAWPSSGDAQVA